MKLEYLALGMLTLTIVKFTFLAKQKFDNLTPVLLRDILIEKFAFFQNIIISLF